MSQSGIRDPKSEISLFSIPVIVAALGYFVDIYDLLLFTLIRKTSLRSLGLSDADVSSVGKSIISWQMTGLLIGGILWGVLGDKKGRLSVLFGSIILYSLANIANGMVHSVSAYTICRFIAGVGLAGELGAGITLVSELLPKEKRGIATSLVAGIGLTGAVVAYFIQLNFDWRICFYIGGGLGLLLLLLRVSVFESGMYRAVEATEVARGNFFMFFESRKRLLTYLRCILTGLPTWYVIGILLAFSDEFGRHFSIRQEIYPAKSIMYAYIAISVGDVLAGLVSQLFRSRKKTLYLFYAITAFALVLFFNQHGGNDGYMYFLCALLGFGTGFWAIFVTIGAEQFGTNLRATAATTIPNFVRGALPLMLLFFEGLQKPFGYIGAAEICGIVVMIVSTIAAITSKETFGRDLDFLEK